MNSNRSLFMAMKIENVTFSYIFFISLWCLCTKILPRSTSVLIRNLYNTQKMQVSYNNTVKQNLENHLQIIGFTSHGEKQWNYSLFGFGWCNWQQKRVWRVFYKSFVEILHLLSVLLGRNWKGPVHPQVSEMGCKDCVWSLQPGTQPLMLPSEPHLLSVRLLKRNNHLLSVWFWSEKSTWILISFWRF